MKGHFLTLRLHCTFILFKKFPLCFGRLVWFGLVGAGAEAKLLSLTFFSR